MPSGAAAYSIRMVSLYPNPAGDDDYSERVTIRNFGDGALSLAGWMLRDRENVIWDLGSMGSLSSCQEKTYTSDKIAQLLNSGDYISLLAPDSTVVQTVSFGVVKDGEEVKP